MTVARRIDPRALQAPPLARADEMDRRFYRWDFPWPEFAPKPAKPMCWSVTTLLDAGLPKFLHAHYAKMTSDLALDEMDAAIRRRQSVRKLVASMASKGKADVLEKQAAGSLVSLKPAKMTEREFAYRYLAGAAPRHRDMKAAEGSAIHAEAEDLTLTAIGRLLASAESSDDGRLFIPAIPDYPRDIAGRMASFARFVNDFGPRFLMSEASVFSHFGYAGTLDAIMEVYCLLPGELEPRWHTICVDWKSGSGVWPEVALQVCAYRRADFVGLPSGEAFPIPPTDGGAVLHLRDDGYSFKMLDTGPKVWRVFLNTCEVGRFRLPSTEFEKGMASVVIGADIMPGGERP
jgi:hypothetical protein